MDYDIFDDSTTFQLISITMLSNSKPTIDFFLIPIYFHIG